MHTTRRSQLNLAQLCLRQIITLLVICVAIRHADFPLQSANLPFLLRSIRRFLAVYLPLAMLLHGSMSLGWQGFKVLVESLPHSVRFLRRQVAVFLKTLSFASVTWVLGACAFHYLAVLFGISFALQSWETLHWALLLSGLVVLPVAFVAGTNAGSWQRMFIELRPIGEHEWSVLIPAIAALLGTWCGAWPAPLDWGREWQVWPVSCSIAACAAYLLGLLLTIGLAYRHNCIEL